MRINNKNIYKTRIFTHNKYNTITYDALQQFVLY